MLQLLHGELNVSVKTHSGPQLPAPCDIRIESHKDASSEPELRSHFGPLPEKEVVCSRIIESKGERMLSIMRRIAKSGDSNVIYQAACYKVSGGDRQSYFTVDNCSRDHFRPGGRKNLSCQVRVCPDYYRTLLEIMTLSKLPI